jgi:hypothetical protein
LRIVENNALAYPNVCTLCEEKPEGSTVIDVERFTPEHPTYPLNGRKYICERCAAEIVRLSGGDDELTIAGQFEDDARKFLASVRNQLGFLSRTLTYEQVFGAPPPIERKPKRKPAAVSRSENGLIGSESEA